MAVRDVKEYFYKMQRQYAEMQADTKDFEQALKDGYITEDRMKEALEELEPFKRNLDRLTYIMYLLELPARKSKQPSHNRRNKEVLAELKRRGADGESIDAENKSALDAFRAELKKLSGE